MMNCDAVILQVPCLFGSLIPTIVYSSLFAVCFSFGYLLLPMGAITAATSLCLQPSLPDDNDNKKGTRNLLELNIQSMQILSQFCYNLEVLLVTLPNKQQDIVQVPLITE
ncbi:hypothetical protein KIL84_014588 [Mauremys mutica]|uniref:Uncharacterized protein n=1 Tax=Mauremys mutica TaxID=74926 RepID=A0A9D4B0W3_9SAUR|nr:hypothetical protein KIL84_014588 [Mauremys mutica]